MAAPTPSKALARQLNAGKSIGLRKQHSGSRLATSTCKSLERLLTLATSGPSLYLTQALSESSSDGGQPGGAAALRPSPPPGSTSTPISLAALELGQVQPGQEQDPSWGPTLQSTQHLADAQPEVMQLPALLRRHLWRAEQDGGAAAAAETPGNLEPIVSVANEAFVAAAWQSEDPSASQHLVRAAAEWEGGPWFDCVTVRIGGPGATANVGEGDKEDSVFAQLRLLFLYPAGPQQHRTLALVRWFEADDMGTEGLSMGGSTVALRWRRDPLTGAAGCYEVIPLSAVAQRESVQPRLRTGAFIAQWPFSQGHGRPMELGEEEEGAERTEPHFQYEFS